MHILKKLPNIKQLLKRNICKKVSIAAFLIMLLNSPTNLGFSVNYSMFNMNSEKILVSRISQSRSWPQDSTASFTK